MLGNCKISIISKVLFPYPENSTALKAETCQDDIGFGLASAKLQGIFILLACFSHKC